MTLWAVTHATTPLPLSLTATAGSGASFAGIGNDMACSGPRTPLLDLVLT